MKFARWLLGAAAIAVGIVDLVWGAFDSAHQPIQAWGDNVPGRQIFAYLVGVLLVAGGGAVLLNRAVAFGATAIAVCYGIFAIFWLPRLYTAPMVLGQSATVYIDILGGIAQQLIVVMAALLLIAPARFTNAARWIFGLSAIDFGLAHLTGITGNNLMFVPHWMPFGRAFWVVFTGCAFILAGIAILVKRVDVLAARLLALMFFVFSAVTLIPGLAHAPQYQENWGGNAYELVVVASVWILAERLAQLRAA
jgi:uncharacterized membrane protein